MPSSYIASLFNIRFPQNDRYDLSEICKSVFDRYYKGFVSRLQASGYEFPPVARYPLQFGEPLPSTFICTKQGGLEFDPGVGKRCLVFINDGEDMVARVYLVRSVTHKGGGLELFGEGPFGISVKITGDATAAVVVVPIDEVEALTSEGVTRL
jgi:hypothetical protein